MINSFSGKYAFLSNFYPVPGGVQYSLFGILYTFPTVENAYQAAKHPWPSINDGQWVKHLTCSPKESKRLGKLLPIVPDWDTNRVQVMVILCLSKFNNPVLKQLLLDTGDEELVEGNWWSDFYWGVCKGKGENMLGKILMNIRSQKRLEEIISLC